MPLLVSTSAKLGLKNGKLAIKGPGGTDCCCGGCCACCQLEIAWGLGHDVRVILTGAITGDCSLPQLGTDKDKWCVAWGWDGTIMDIACATVIDDPCVYNLADLAFLCPNKGTLADLQIEASYGNLGCDLCGDNAVPAFAQHARKVDTIVCTDDQLVVAETTFPLCEQQAGGCDVDPSCPKWQKIRIEALQVYTCP